MNLTIGWCTQHDAVFYLLRMMWTNSATRQVAICLQHNVDKCPFFQTYYDDTSSLLKTKRIIKRFFFFKYYSFTNKFFQFLFLKKNAFNFSSSSKKKKNPFHFFSSSICFNGKFCVKIVFHVFQCFVVSKKWVKG